MYTTGAFLEADVQANLCGLACTHEGQAPPPLSFHSSFFSQLLLFTALLALFLSPCFSSLATLWLIRKDITLYMTLLSALRQQRRRPYANERRRPRCSSCWSSRQAKMLLRRGARTFQPKQLCWSPRVLGLAQTTLITVEEWQGNHCQI